jgi:hypothetical protein
MIECAQIIFDHVDGVVIHREGAIYWTEDASRPGLFVSGGSLAELKEALVEARSFYDTG